MSERDPDPHPGRGRPPGEPSAGEGGGRRRRGKGRRRDNGRRRENGHREHGRQEDGRRRDGRRRERRGRAGGRRPRISLFAVGLFVLLFAGAGGYVFMTTYVSPPDYSGRGTDSVVVRIEEGASVASIGSTLEGADVVKSERAFINAAESHPESTSLQPGHYELRRRMAAQQALERLLDPSSRVQAKVTIPEGKRLAEILRLVARKTDMSVKELEQAAENESELGLPSYAETVEGYLFPATYTVAPDDTPEKLLSRMVDEFEAVAENHDIVAQAEQRGLTPHELITVASLVQGEVSRPRDFPKTAAVVYNRLDEGMRLEFSSTVNYALGQRKLGVSERETKVDSPYNTYQHKGLPPGPVNSPGERALQAAADPAQGRWLYFVTTRPDKGITKFTANYDEFLEFKREFQRNTS